MKKELEKLESAFDFAAKETKSGKSVEAKESAQSLMTTAGILTILVEEYEETPEAERTAEEKAELCELISSYNQAVEEYRAAYC